MKPAGWAALPLPADTKCLATLPVPGRHAPRRQAPVVVRTAAALPSLEQRPAVHQRSRRSCAAAAVATAAQALPPTAQQALAGPPPVAPGPPQHHPAAAAIGSDDDIGFGRGLLSVPGWRLDSDLGPWCARVEQQAAELQAAMHACPTGTAAAWHMHACMHACVRVCVCVMSVRVLRRSWGGASQCPAASMHA